MTDLEDLKKRLREDHPLDAPTAQAADAIEQLQRELDMLHGKKFSNRNYTAIRSKIANLERELEEARRDAERLDFVLKNGLPMHRDGKFRFHGFVDLGWFESQIQAIDAAREQQG